MEALKVVALMVEPSLDLVGWIGRKLGLTLVRVLSQQIWEMVRYEVLILECPWKVYAPTLG